MTDLSDRARIRESIFCELDQIGGAIQFRSSERDLSFHFCQILDKDALRIFDHGDLGDLVGQPGILVVRIGRSRVEPLPVELIPWRRRRSFQRPFREANQPFIDAIQGTLGLRSRPLM